MVVIRKLFLDMGSDARKSLRANGPSSRESLPYPRIAIAGDRDGHTWPSSAAQRTVICSSRCAAIRRSSAARRRTFRRSPLRSLRISHIVAKLQVTDRAEAIIKARDAGLPNPAAARRRAARARVGGGDRPAGRGIARRGLEQVYAVGPVFNLSRASHRREHLDELEGRLSGAAGA